jgi:hypothetical protein
LAKRAMSLEIFEARRFQPKTLALIEQANAIIAEYQARGFVLILRQLFYQFVARGLLANLQSEYKRLGHVIVCARRAGLIDWDAIEDRTRNVQRLPSWTDPPEIIEAVSQQYREDLWADQPFLVECWIEKESLIGVIRGVCDEFRVPYFACRGNTSEPEAYAAGKRFEGAIASGRAPIVLHLGDHDPTGLDMTRDNRDRLAMFARQDVEVRRLALNIDQVERFSLPPNPAKDSDSRYAAYAARFGPECWELDALDPTVIADLIRAELENLIDVETWQAAEAQEDANRALLADTSRNWAKVETLLGRAR